MPRHTMLVLLLSTLLSDAGDHSLSAAESQPADHAAATQPRKVAKPGLYEQFPPTRRDHPYGEGRSRKLDFWKARGTEPAPLVVHIHGGGFTGGDKSIIPPQLLRDALDAGFAVASINYRLTDEGPFPGPMHDSARAIQYLRSKAREWSTDPKRVCATGGSAGAGASLWLAFHDDLADPDDPDPVLRQSSRLTCAAVHGAQTSYDPRWVTEKIGAPTANHRLFKPLFALAPGEEDSPRALRLYKEASPIEHLTADDPPVLLAYSEADKPVPPDAAPGAGIHHPRFGQLLAEKAKPLGVTCILKDRGDYANQDALAAGFVSFFVQQCDMKPAERKE